MLTNLGGFPGRKGNMTGYLDSKLVIADDMATSLVLENQGD